MPKLTSLEDLFIQELQDTYLAEGQILKAVQAMMHAASYPGLRSVFRVLADQTEGHLRRLERVFTLVGLPPRGTAGDGIIGLLRESEKAIHQDAEPEVVDAALICAAQKLAHYEIASYSCLCTYAEMLGFDQAHDLLSQALDDEEITDVQLTELAETVIHTHAVQGEHA
jgi:ferritin-like metal-binding protein YciE